MKGNSLMDKKVAVSKTVDGGSIPSSPATFDIKKIKTWADIPDSHIYANYVLSEHRTKTKKTLTKIPLISAFADYIHEHYGVRTEIDQHSGLEVSPELFREAVKNLVPSDAGMGLFNKILFFRQGNRFVIDGTYIHGYEIVLVTEAIDTESDRRVLTRLKKREWLKEDDRRASQILLKKRLKNKKVVLK